jgi:hypothetical protein
VAYATVPFVLLTISGIPLGFVLRFGVRRLSSVPDPLRVRRLRSTIVPLGLATVIALIGTAALVPDGVAAIVLWWPWAFSLPIGVAVFVWMSLGLPRWWRLLGPLGVGLVFGIPGLLAWSWVEPGEGGMFFTGEAWGRVVPAIVRTGEESDGAAVVALVRVAPDRSGAREGLSLRVIPAVPLIPTAGDGSATGDAAERSGTVPPPTVVPPDEPVADQPVSAAAPSGSISISLDARLTLSLSLERYIPPLWWFPRGTRVSVVAVRLGLTGIELWRPPSPVDDLPAVSLPVGERVPRNPGAALVIREEADLPWPGESGRFLQPGVYILEYRRE